VLGLGDSSYQKFCQTAREIDARLDELGATRLAARQDCDVDYEEEAEGWSRSVLDAFTACSAPVVAAAAAPVVTSAYDEATPFPAPILESIRITGRGSDKVVRHVELSLAGSGLTYQPGDALAVQPRNDPALVAELIHLLRFDGDTGLAGVLEREREITVATPRFVERFAPLAKSRALTRLVKPEQRAALETYLKDRQISDIVREHPAKGLTPDAFVAMLRRLRPRLYSLASSPAAFPDEAHLTIGLVEFGAADHRRHGTTSGLLALRLGVDDTVPVHVVANPHFHLPTDPAAPIIMIGAGTGVAPFRAFLQHREAVGAAGRSWLVFGDRRMRTDFLYQTEMLAWIKSGVLSRMDVAFSRDQASKIYVQHRLRERGRDLFAWLEEGASVYVCGDAAGMAPSVEAALVDLIAEHGGLSSERAAAYLADLSHSGRYRRDVY
jgi:sulfite reductase (NADPH) flavoprotein alpha-component